MVGTIGVMQALQAIKIILDLPGVLSGRLLLFDGLDTTFKNIRLRGKNPDCAACGLSPTIRELIDYEEFCGAKANDKNPNLKILGTNERICVEEYSELAKDSAKTHLLIDVRSEEEFQICHLKNSINIPIGDIDKKSSLNTLRNEISKAKPGLLNGALIL